jgi:hypothetical protein
MLDDEEILDYANEEMEIHIVPLIVSKHQDYYLIREDFPVKPNKIEYPIPYRAIGSQLRKVCVADSGGSLGTMVRITVDDLVTDSVSFQSRNRRYYIQGENIVLDSSNGYNVNEYIVMFYNIRPNSLVLSEKVAIIENIDRENGLILVNNIPDHFELDSKFDFIKTKAPHKIISFDLNVLDIQSSTKLITISPDLIPEQLLVGDRIALAGETDVLNCPSELHVMLAQAVATRILESIGDIENLGAADKKLQTMQNNAANLLDNRVVGSPIKVKPNRGLGRSRRR